MIAAHRSTVFLNTDDFAEAVTYLPKSGSSRTVTAIIEDVTRLRDLNGGIVNTEEIEVFVGRDASADEGGVDSPQIGDGLMRSAANDPTQKVYSFIGDITDIEPDGWTLLFRRDVIRRQGHEQTQER